MNMQFLLFKLKSKQSKDVISWCRAVFKIIQKGLFVLKITECIIGINLRFAARSCERNSYSLDSFVWK